MLIVGAGLSGLIAAMMLPDAQVVEAGPESQVNHKALLRFRSQAVSQVTGIDFQRVLVRKGIYFDGWLREPNIKLANMYARKVTGKIQPRSIWDIAPAERYIAPEDFAQQLAHRMRDRITWNEEFKFVPGIGHDIGPIISTVPMYAILEKMKNVKSVMPSHLSFNYQRICVRRFRIPNCDVHQTIYFPDPLLKVYRASITGDLLIIESIVREDDDFPSVGSLTPELQEIFRAFDIDGNGCSMSEVGFSQQKHGKISPIDDKWRKSFMYEISTKHNIYSLGRFATWRNILLDDVVNDVYVIKRLMNSDKYEHARSST